MQRIIIVVHCIFIINVSYLSAQSLDYTRKILDDLCSPEMHGRGYVKDGDLKAARYIAKEFKTIGLEKPVKKYFQYFEISVNTFPSQLILKINDTVLLPGKDFLVHPGSPSAQGEFEAVTIEKQALGQNDQRLKILAKMKDKYLVINESTADDKQTPDEEKEKINELFEFIQKHPDNPAHGTILFTDKKLTWKGSTELFPKPFFIVNTETDPNQIHHVYLDIESIYYESYLTQNVVGLLTGKKYPDSLIVFTAHYDHLGRMGGDTYFPGANDNASGVAMILNLARYYSQLENIPDYTMAFIAFGAEEMGLAGASFFAENPVFPLKNISFLINIDLAGSGEEGITVVNATVHRQKFDLLKEINDSHGFLPRVKVRGPACNSDHCKFHEKGVPCFFLYTMGGSTAYHDIYDTPESLPLTMFENYFKLLKSFADSLQTHD